MYTHIQKIYARFISNAPILAICSKKKNITNTFFCCLPCWSMQFYKIKEKNLQVPEQHGLQKKKYGLGGDSLTVTVFSLHFL